MNLKITNYYQEDCTLVKESLKSGTIENKALEAGNRLMQVASERPDAKELCDALYIRITTAALIRGLAFRPSKPLALISGAGIAGLAASLELRARGMNVVIVEKRDCFSRFNVINLNIETKRFLDKFNLREEFEASVAGRITEHRIVLIKRGGAAECIDVSDVRALQLNESIPFEPDHFDALFTKDGIYSVPIMDLQMFLARKALEAGVNILGNVTPTVLSRKKGGGVSEVEIRADRTLRPDLFFIAEGVHSTTASKLGMKTVEVSNACAGESWIFGNMAYSGEESFVVSLIDTSESTLKIANVIFNGKSGVINIAVSSERVMTKEEIEKQVSKTVAQVFTQKTFKLLGTVERPVHIANRTRLRFSMGNVFCIGDSAGSSSPLAGLGGTLGLTLVPATVTQLVDDYERHSHRIHDNFHKFSKGSTTRWMEKSDGIKKICVSLFEKEHSQ